MMKYTIKPNTNVTLYIFEADRLIDVKNDELNYSSHQYEPKQTIIKNDIKEILDRNGKTYYVPNIGFVEITHKIMRDIYSANMIGFVRPNGVYTLVYVTNIAHINILD